MEGIDKAEMKEKVKKLEEVEELVGIGGLVMVAVSHAQSWTKLQRC